MGGLDSNTDKNVPEAQIARDEIEVLRALANKLLHGLEPLSRRALEINNQLGALQVIEGYLNALAAKSLQPDFKGVREDLDEIERILELLRDHPNSAHLHDNL